MNNSTTPDAIGWIANFSSTDSIDGNGVHYFEFALTLPPPFPPEPPTEHVYYVDLTKPYAPNPVSVIPFAWASHARIAVYLDKSIPQKSRVMHVEALSDDYRFHGSRHSTIQSSQKF